MINTQDGRTITVEQYREEVEQVLKPLIQEKLDEIEEEFEYDICIKYIEVGEYDIDKNETKINVDWNKV